MDEIGDATCLMAVWSSDADGRVLGLPGPLFTVFKRGSDGLCRIGGSGFFTTLRMTSRNSEEGCADLRYDWEMERWPKWQWSHASLSRASLTLLRES